MGKEIQSKSESQKMTLDELRYRQSLSLKDKIDLSCERIEKWYDHWSGNVYVAFSGAKIALFY